MTEEGLEAVEASPELGRLLAEFRAGRQRARERPRGSRRNEQAAQGVRDIRTLFQVVPPPPPPPSLPY